MISTPSFSSSLAQFLHQIIIYYDCCSHICIIISAIFNVKMTDTLCGFILIQPSFNSLL